MVRFISVVKKIRQNRKKDLAKLDGNSIQHPLDKQYEEYEPSQIFKRLSDMISKKVILGVLAMLLVVPLLEVDTIDYGPSIGVEMLNTMAATVILSNNRSFSSGNVEFLSTELGAYIDEYSSQTTTGVLVALNLTNSIVVADTLVCQPVPDCLLAVYRTTEVLCLACFEFQQAYELQQMSIATSSSNMTTPDGRVLRGVYSQAFWDVKSESVQSAIYSMILTVFVIALLGLGAALFSRDTNRLVVRPIERMTKLVRGLAEDPLATLRESERSKRRRQAVRPRIECLPALTLSLAKRY